MWSIPLSSASWLMTAPLGGSGGQLKRMGVGGLIALVYLQQALRQIHYDYLLPFIDRNDKVLMKRDQ